MIFSYNCKKHKGINSGLKVLYISLCFLLVLIFPYQDLYSQISRGGLPASFNYSRLQSIPVIKLAPPSLDLLKAEDDAAEKQALPRRIGMAVKADLDVLRDGNYVEMEDGTRIWRLSVECHQALAMSPCFGDFMLPEGYSMFVYNETHNVVLGAYTSINNKENHLFSTELVAGDKLVIEIDAIPGTKELPSCFISEFSYVYRDLPDFVQNRGTADGCEVNINCPEGINWQNQKRGVARIYVKRGTGFFWCTGSLLNNTQNDHTPYFITADHCAPEVTPAELSEWIFYFNYEAPGCENPTVNPTPNSLNGAVKLANASTNGSDFLFLRFDNEVPENFEPFFNGWNNADEPSPNGVTIHHPAGDIKKISTYTEPVQSSQWAATVGTHWLVYWTPTTSGWGVTEGGSSGSPLFDNSGRIIGTLTGGESSCENDGSGNGSGPDKPDYYGKFSYSWDKNGSEPANQLKYWLDPLNTGVTSVNGVNLNLTAGFEADETLLLIGGTVNYSNLSSGLPISWEWTFEGGDPSTFSGKEPPEIKYLSGGMFDTKLVVSDGINYDTLLLTEYIHVVGKVFPNPASKIVNIYLDVQLPAVVYAEIYDLIGQKVLSKEFPNQSFRVVTLDISTLPVGIYLVRLQIQQRFIFAKIVVNH